MSTHELTNALISVYNPADGQLVGRVPDATAEEVQRVVQDLRQTQPGWEELGPAARAVWLRRLRDWLLDNEQAIADVLQSETAKPRAEAALETPVLCDILNYQARHAERFLRDERVRPHSALTRTKRLTRRFRPYP